MDGVRVGEGRFDRGLRLLRGSWEYLGARPRLLTFPAIAAVALTLAALAVGVPAALLARDLDLPGGFVVLFVVAVCSFPLTAISTFLNVAFLLMVADEQAGLEPSASRALAGARARLGPVLAWSALATVVGVALQALQHIPYVGDWLGRILSAVGGLAWSLVTFFVVPILALHGTGARTSVRRSAEVFRRRWGESVTGDLAIGFAAGFAILPGAFCGGLGIALWMDGHSAGAALIVVGVALAVPVFVLQSAVTQLFQLSVYRLVASGQVVGPYAEVDLEGAVKPKRRWWRRRAV